MQFIFGKPVLPVAPRARGQRQLFVLGAYPSALHVWWHPTGALQPIKAIAVDNEPEPFWNGRDEIDRIERWKSEVGYQSGWGKVGPCGRFNGSSGNWVWEKILAPLHIDVNEAWLTDCLNIYYESNGAAARMNSEEMSKIVKTLKIKPRQHKAHPSESQIVQTAKAEHIDRLKAEIVMAQPELIVTLGNAALKVFSNIADLKDMAISKLSADENYGTKHTVEVCGINCKWIPLAHPAAPQAYQTRHETWVARGNANT